MAEQQMVEDWIASGKSRFQIENKLKTHNIPPDEATALIDAAETAFSLKRQRRLTISRLVGIAILVFGGGLSIWGFFFLDGGRVVSTAWVAIGLVGLIVTLEPSTLEHFNRMFGRRRKNF